MIDADSARISRALVAIEVNTRKLAAVAEALNINFVTLIKKIEEWETMDILDNTDKENGNMGNPQDNDAVEIHDLVEDINTLQAETGQQTTVVQDD